ncbi:unnamed protein product [Acanthosepion pharaonis]|uniref:Uncharacterized protein n=1 Tax=Acanthosepion pharaonis TaxID=158019 RepID=A0A812C699_ACAPH|nr:unnamed protein product [Sepia pharaonis]
MHLCLPLFPCIFVSLCFHASLSLCLFLCVFVSLCFHASVSPSVSMHHCLPVSIHLCLPLFPCICVSLSPCQFPSIFVSMLSYLSVPFSSCLCFSILFCSSVCPFPSTFLCLFLSDFNSSLALLFFVILDTPVHALYIFFLKAFLRNCPSILPIQCNPSSDLFLC